MDMDWLAGIPLGILLGILLDRFILTPLVYWHAQLARRGRR